MPLTVPEAKPPRPSGSSHSARLCEGEDVTSMRVRCRRSQGGFRVAPPTPECYRPAVNEGHSVTPGAAGPSWLLRLLLVGLVVAGVAWLYYGLDLPGHASVAGMRALVDAHAPYGPLVFMAMLVAGILTQIPMMGHLLVAVGGVLWSALPAFAYGWV